MKVGILNLQYSMNNYGAVLQAAALQYIIQELGHEVCHIDFMAPRPMTLRARVGKLFRDLGLRQRESAIEVMNLEAFETFRATFIRRTKRVQDGVAFSAVSQEFDAVVVGSDQVWRPEYTKDPVAFFLGYVPEGIRRIAYAASFGTSTWQCAEDVTLTQRIRLELACFTAVSCREDSGVEICESIFDIDAEHVLDPLLLVGHKFLERIMCSHPRPAKQKVVYYKLNVNKKFLDDLRILGEHFGVAPVNMSMKCQPELGGIFRHVAEWFNLLQDCEVVITDSFHCVCLALRFGKRIVYCPNEERGQARMDSLFQQLDLTPEAMEVPVSTAMFILRESPQTLPILEKLRGRSMQYLARALA